MVAAGGAVTSCLLLAAFATPQDNNIDTDKSTITVHVGKSGLFSAAGHEHWVIAPILIGKFNDSRVDLTINARGMKVKPEVSPKDQAEIQDTMEKKVLEIEKYPQIQFRSSSITNVSEGSWKVEGTLTLPGVNKPISVDVKKESDAYTANVRIKQTDFGIQPISVAGGVVKVKNELEIHFEIYAFPN